MNANDVLTVEVKAVENVVSDEYKVCYKHGEEDPYLMYPFVFKMLYANNITVSHGSSSLFVENQPKNLLVSGQGLNEEDVFYLTERNECRSAEDAVKSFTIGEMPTDVVFSDGKEYHDLYACLLSTTYNVHVTLFMNMGAWRPSVAMNPVLTPVQDLGDRIMFNSPTEFIAEGAFVGDGE